MNDQSQKSGHVYSGRLVYLVKYGKRSNKGMLLVGSGSVRDDQSQKSEAYLFRHVRLFGKIRYKEQ